MGQVLMPQNVTHSASIMPDASRYQLLCRHIRLRPTYEALIWWCNVTRQTATAAAHVYVCL